MNEPNPSEGIAPGPAPASPPRDAIASGAAPTPAPAQKKPYEKYDDLDQAMPSLAHPGGSEGSGMQSLAQSARGSKLNQARWTMIIIGILTIGANLFVYFANHDAVVQIRMQGQHLPPEIARNLELFEVSTIGFALLGGVFIALGLGVKAYPLPCTIFGLVLYGVGILIGVALDPTALVQGIIWKVVIIFGLIGAIKAAWAYECEQKQFEVPA